MERVLTSIGLTGVEGRGCRYSGCKMWPVLAVSIFSTLMGRRFAWRRGSEGGTACTKGLVLPAGDEPGGPGREQFPESALVQAGSAPPPPLCLLLRRAESEGAVLMTHPRAWEQRGGGLREVRGGLGAARSPGSRSGCSSRRRRSWRGGHQRSARLLGAGIPKRIILGGRRRCRGRAGEAGRTAGARVARGVCLGLRPCVAHSRPRAAAALCDVSCCLSSRGSGEETHFKSSCTEGEIKAFAAFQSNGSPR